MQAIQKTNFSYYRGWLEFDLPYVSPAVLLSALHRLSCLCPTTSSPQFSITVCFLLLMTHFNNMEASDSIQWPISLWGKCKYHQVSLRKGLDRDILRDSTFLESWKSACSSSMRQSHPRVRLNRRSLPLSPHFHFRDNSGRQQVVLEPIGFVLNLMIILSTFLMRFLVSLFEL